MQQYNYSYYETPSFVDPFLDNFMEPSKKETPKLSLDIPYGDSSLAFLSPSILRSFNEPDIEQIFQPLLDDTCKNVMTPTFLEQEFHFNPEEEKNVQEQSSEHMLEDEDNETVSKKEINPERTWSTAYKNELVGNGDVEISLKTRREKPTSLVPERLYSSLKYEVQITATGEFVRPLPFLLARISVVDAITLQPISKNNKAVTKGENESALTHPPNGPGNIIKGAIKVQFDSSISYHHDKREVCLEINFFMNEALDQPVLTKRTVPVKMFARKPNKKQTKNVPLVQAPPCSSKRKRDQVQEEPQSKIAKVDSFQLSDFEKKLDALVESSRSLSYEDRQRATGLIFSKFGLSFVFTNPDPFTQYQF